MLRGSRTYCCSSRQNRGLAVCDCMATVNAAEAEARIIDELEGLFCNEEVLRRVTEQVQRLITERQTGPRWRRGRAAELHKQLAETEAEIARLVEAIAKGVLVEALAERMRVAEVRREHLQRELAAAQKKVVVPGLDLLPDAVRRVVGDLRGMLEAGQIEGVKSALGRLVTSIEVHEEPRAGRKRPGTVLMLRGNLQAALRLIGENVTSANSPGGIRTRDLMAENHAS